MENYTFKETPNSFLDTVFNTKRRSDIKYPDSDQLQTLTSISGLYQYSNPPPMGYGTPAPKVAETVLRAYSMNKNPDHLKSQVIDGIKVDTPAWRGGLKDFPWFEPASNFCAPTVKLMVRDFTKANRSKIQKTVEDVMTTMLVQNSDVLTKGRQTFCPLTESSLPCAIAYRNMMEFFSKNGGPKTCSVIGLITEFFRLLQKCEEGGLNLKTTTIRVICKNAFKDGCLRPTTRRLRVSSWKKFEKKEAYNILLGFARSFCTYIKHGERAHLKRRAIASPNIIMRAFLLVIEQVHLKLGRELDGSTISIGGEEKKDRIMKVVNSLSSESRNIDKKQATEDATKWNETLSAALFGLVHHFMFDGDFREESGIEKPSALETLYAEICQSAHYLLAIKRVTLGPGLQGRNSVYHGEIAFEEASLPAFNETTRSWVEKILPLKEGNNYILASPGMLMGMHNALSTTVGLINVGFLHLFGTFIRTLRSSDDSMTVHAGNGIEDLSWGIDKQYQELKLSAIALSPKKTLLFRAGFGEFTSWFQDGKMVSQFGPETTTLRPGGRNPSDDFYSAAKSVHVSLLNCTSNPIGAEVKLTLAINNIRSLYKIKVAENTDDGVKPISRVFADGGINVYDIGNCHLEETSLREHFSDEAGKNYLLKIRNPNNPFAGEAEEQTYFDKDVGCLYTDFLENPRNVFTYVRRGNRASTNKKGLTNADSERSAQEAMDIITSLDQSTLIVTPSEATPAGQFLFASLSVLIKDLELSIDEMALVNEASRILKGEPATECDDYEEREESDSD